VRDLPSFTRIQFTVLGLEHNQLKIVNKNPNGIIIGSASTPLFDFERKMKTGFIELSLWPFEKQDQRMVC